MRLTGRKAAVYVGGVKIGELQEWVATASFKTIESQAAGDKFTQRAPDIGDVKVTAKRFTLVAGLGSFFDMVMSAAAADEPSPLTVICYARDVDASTRCYEGPMWPEEGTINAGTGKHVEEDVTFVSAGDPVYWVGMYVADMSNEVKILTKEQLRAAASEDRTDILPLPELGEGVAVRVRGFTWGDVMDINQASTIKEDGVVVGYDTKQDSLLSVMKALVEPKIDLADTAWIQSLPPGIGLRIINKAKALGYRTASSYEEMKALLQANPYLWRIYSLCVNKLGRLPIELRDIPEAEFNTALAALELDAAAEEEAMAKILENE